MYNLQYQVVAASNYLPFFKIHTCTPGTLNWESTPHAATPIEIVLKLRQTAYLLKISICPHFQSSIKQLQVWTANNENYVQASFEEAGKMVNATQNNCTLNVNKICRLVKLVIKDKPQGKSVGISTVMMAGDFSVASYPKTETASKNVYRSLLELGISASEGDYEKDLEALDIDQETKITIRDLSKLQPGYLQQENYDELESLRSDIKQVIKLGERIVLVQRDLDWATAKENFKDMKTLAEELRRLRQSRDRYDQLYETTRFQKMVEHNNLSEEYDNIYAKLVKDDQENIKMSKQKQDNDINYRRMLVHNEYHQIRKENPPWWERDTPNLDDMESTRPAPVVEEVKPAKPIKREPKVVQKNVAVHKPAKSEKKAEKEKYDFSNPYIFNQGDVDLQKYINSEISGAFSADDEILRKYEDLEYLKVLGSRIWSTLHSENWRQRQLSAQSVVQFASGPLPEKYQDGDTIKLFQSLLEFSWICFHDKVVSIYMLGLRILSAALRPPICAGRVTAEILNKGIRKFVPKLIKKIEQSNSKVKEASLETLLSIFQHPSSDPSILHKEIIKGLHEQVYNGKIISADKLPARIVAARLQIALKMLQKIDVKNKNIDTTELFDLLAGPSLLHSNYQVRITAIQLVGELYRYIGEPMLKKVVDLHELRPGISEMVIARLKNIKQSFVGKQETV